MQGRNSIGGEVARSTAPIHRSPIRQSVPRPQTAKGQETSRISGKEVGGRM